MDRVVAEVHYDSLEEMLKAVVYPDRDGLLYSRKHFIFRGESSKSYKLIPSALRKIDNKPLKDQGGIDLGFPDYEPLQIEAEYKLLKDFYIIANNSGLKLPKVKCFNDNYHSDAHEHLKDTKDHIWIDEDMEELAALAQHYGVKTRMLDWTFDINVALYFASIGVLRRALKTNKNPSKNHRIVIWALNAYLIRKLQTISEKMEFPLRFVIPSYYGNPNLCAQKGILTSWRVTSTFAPQAHVNIMNEKTVKKVDRTPLDKLLIRHMDDCFGSTFLYRITIPAKESMKVFDYVRDNGYSASLLFPGYGGVVKEMEEDDLVMKLKYLKKW